MRRVAEELATGGPILVLIPARLDQWWWDYVWGVAARVWSVRGRLKFEDDDGSPAAAGAAFSSALVEYRPGRAWATQQGLIDRDGSALRTPPLVTAEDEHLFFEALRRESARRAVGA